MIRLMVPDIAPEDEAAVLAVLRGGMLVQGEQVRAFETELAQAVGTKHAVVVSNCTAALQLTLLALDIKPGDKVAVAAYSWPATANVVELCGAIPVFVDVDPQTGCMAPEALEDVLKRHAGIRAVLPVHALGRIAEMDRLVALANAHDEIPVLEDAACALGASWQGRNAGAWGKAACFSFHPRKALTTGEGGAITTDDDALARQLRVLRNHGQDPEASGPDFIAPGFNQRMTEFQAALGRSQLSRFEALLAKRRALAERYDALLSPHGIITPLAPPRGAHAYQSYAVQLAGFSAVERDRVVAGLRARGVEATIGTYHLPLVRFYRETYGYAPGMFPGADSIAAQSLTLPLHAGLSEADQARVVDALVTAGASIRR